MSCNQWFRRIGHAALLGALLLAVVPAQAYDRYDNCAHRIRKAEAQLDDAIRKHGPHSRQAEKRRHELERVREQCGRRDRH